MKKKKIYQIHTDYKFLHDSNRFDDERFENVLIIIGNEAPQHELKFKTIFIQKNDENLIEKVIHQSKNADLIVINELCEIKKEIVKKTPNKVNIAWRFFGHELYGKRRDLVLSKNTLKIVENTNTIFHELIFKLKLIKRRIHYFQNDHKIVNRIDYILLFFEEEYDFLKKHWKVPEFVKLNLNYKIEEKGFEFLQKKNNVIVGNSRNIFNNHLDVLDIIEKNDNGNNTFTLFFNYGASGKYEKKIRAFSNNPNIFFIEDFLSKKDFEKIYEESKALVINSYRQMALGNIFTAIKYGLKLYLNDKNPTKDWLIRNKIKIHSVEDFEKDLRTGNLSLSIEDKYQNVINFNNLVDKFSREEFCTSIWNKIITKNEK